MGKFKCTNIKYASVLSWDHRNQTQWYHQYCITACIWGTLYIYRHQSCLCVSALHSSKHILYVVITDKGALHRNVDSVVSFFIQTIPGYPGVNVWLVNEGGTITANYTRYKDITHWYNDTRCIVSDCTIIIIRQSRGNKSRRAESETPSDKFQWLTFGTSPKAISQ